MKRVYMVHDTCVAYIKDDGSCLLHSGGFRTATTKRHMNKALQEHGFTARVVQEKGEWFVVTAKIAVPYTDGMLVVR